MPLWLHYLLFFLYGMVVMSATGMLTALFMLRISYHHKLPPPGKDDLVGLRSGKVLEEWAERRERFFVVLMILNLAALVVGGIILFALIADLTRNLTEVRR